MNETIALPPLIDAQGNINVHGRSGIYWPFKMYTCWPGGTEIDISTWTLTFEVAGVLSQELVADPNDALGQLLIIDDLAEAGLTITPPNFPLYTIRDTTGANPKVRAEGKIIIRGYETAPP